MSRSRRSTSCSRSAASSGTRARAEQPPQPVAGLGDTLLAGLGRGDEDGAAVVRVRHTLGETGRRERVDRPRRGRVARPDAVGEHAGAQRATVHDDGEREPLRRGQRGRLGRLPPRTAHKRSVETLDRLRQRVGAGHSATASATRRGRRPGVTTRATRAASTAATQAAQNAAV